MHSPFAKPFLITVLGGLALAHSARAITIRDDTPDSSYIALGAQSTYEAAGAFSGGSFGGTLITDPFGLDEYVLTAAHLVAANQIVPGTTEFLIGGNYYDVAYTVTAPSFNLSGHLENDLALVRLASPVTGVTPVPYYTGSAELNQTITLIGYGFTGTGLTGGQAGTAGTRRGANNVIDALDASTISSSLNSTSYLTDFDNPTGTSNTLGLAQTGGAANSSPLPLTLEGSTAEADSGGGDFATIDGTLYLVGVHSYLAAPSGNPDAGDPDGHYGDVDGSTRVSLFSGFIAQNIPEPGSAALLVGGVAVLSGLRRRRTGGAA